MTTAGQDVVGWTEARTTNLTFVKKGYDGPSI